MDTTIVTKTFVLLRMDFAPRPDVTQALVPHMVPDTGKINVMPGVVISVFESLSSIEQIRKSLNQCNGILYVCFEATKENIITQLPGKLGNAIVDQINPVEEKLIDAKLIKQLQQQLDAAVQEQDFEEAAKLRDQINNLKKS